MSRRAELNRLVRERIPGGDCLLKALASADRMVQDRQTDSHAQDLLQLLRQAADEARERVNQTRSWPAPTYSSTEAAELLGLGKRTVTEIAKRKGIGEMRAGRLALTVEDALAIRQASQGRPGAPKGNQYRAGK